ncbi:hypothetical protein [Pseudotenacibaculum haliotis]|uniref:Phage protein D n=1 Tax=Pseudotenacibaculum haliotis TaxID=1862138 RepID=A0ABW5LMN1_9FLAO
MSTYIMTCRITFFGNQTRDDIVLRFVESVRIESSWKLLTDSATITLPRRVLKRVFDKDKIRDVFRRGDRVTIELGYYDSSDNKNQGLKTEFEGYITHVSADIPIKIKCEDEMWRLKQVPVNYSKANVTLKELLKDILPGYQIDANEGELLGSVRFSETTASQVLEKLKQDKNIYSYFKGSTLVSGKIYSDDSNVESHYFNLERNAVSNNLQYRRAEDVKVQFIVRSFVRGKKSEFKIGEQGGDVYKLNYVGPSYAELDKLKEKAREDYNRVKSDGLEGNFVAFGTPSVRHGEKVELDSTLYLDRVGMYYVEGVNKSFDRSGYRQMIKLDRKVS